MINLLQVDSIISDGFGQACQKYRGKSVISFVTSLKKVTDEVRDL